MMAQELAAMQPNGADGTGRFSSADRRAIIAQLIKKKREQLRGGQPGQPGQQPQQQATGAPAPPTAQQQQQQQQQQPQYASEQYGAPMGADGDPYWQQQHVQPPLPPGANPVEDDDGALEDPTGLIDGGDAQEPSVLRRRGEGPRAHPHSGRGGGGGPDGTRDHHGQEVDVRTQRLLRSEEMIREEMLKECTFHPQLIRPDPTLYGTSKNADNGLPFYVRVMKWKRDRAEENERKKQEMDSSSLEDCTFNPTINPSSRRAARQMMAAANRSGMSNSGSAGGLTTAERLYHTVDEHYENMERLHQEKREREEEQFEQDCTFEPRLATSKRWAVAPRYMQASPPRSRRGGDPSKNDPAMKECTFTPQVNGVRRNMNTAYMYAEADVHERLAQTGALNSSSAHNRSMVGGGAQRPTSAPPRQRPGSAAASGQQPARTPRERQQQFSEFLSRQAEMEVRRERSQQRVANQTQASFTPRLAPGTKRYVGRAGPVNGTFQQRLDRDLHRRQMDSNRRSGARDMRPKDCTFQPEVTRMSERVRSRSVYEMSQGDMLQRETSMRLMRLKAEQDEMSTLTFRPKITKHARNTQSALQLAGGGADTYLQRVRAAKSEAEERRRSEQKRHEDANLQECTFRPETRDCPAYVARIARSMRLAKKARQTEEPKRDARPEWR